MTDDKVYEVKKTVTLTKHMQLIDLNGLRVNFQSDCIFTVKPDQRFQACIVTQDDLDEGRVNFENSENGKYARRVVYTKNVPLNHFAALRLDPKEGENVENEEGMECSVVVRLKELKHEEPVEKKKSVTFADEQKNENNTRTAMQKQLQELSDDPSYSLRREEANVNLDQLLKNDDLTDVNDTTINNVATMQRDGEPRSRPWNIWIWIGIFCFLLCGILWWRQSTRELPIEEIVPKLE